MSNVEHLDRIIEQFGPHLHDTPYGGWQSDRVIDKVVPTHCPFCGVQCGMNLLVEKDHLVGFEPRYDFPVNEGRLCPKGVTAYLQTHHPDRLEHPTMTSPPPADGTSTTFPVAGLDRRFYAFVLDRLIGLARGTI